ncbi:MAG: AAA family ATPase [Phycisphaerales bacterium]|nr:AAA family ATPase [Phycisphaerales bacterium]MCB9857094.1 AAA family ATPase [Phycisphaerales bacterium]MCB9861779.1 AAA family ATPase [Phycisphaerales bacterium]
MECIAVINQKGGVGKTSTAVNLGAGLGQRGKRMLLIDLDPQGHLTTHFGLDEAAPDKGVYEVLTGSLPLSEAIHTYSPSIDIVPAHVDLAAAETELVSVVGREVILRDALRGGDWPYDIVMFDCPPSLGVLSLNAMCAANRVLIPVQPHFLALQGTGKLFETILLVNQRINAALSVMGIAICLNDAGTRLSSEVVDDLSAFLDSHRDSNVPWCNARIFNSRIRRNVKLAECPSYGQSIFEYAPRSNGATDYLALADEVLAVLSGRALPVAVETTDQIDDESSDADVETAEADVSIAAETVDGMAGDDASTSEDAPRETPMKAAVESASKPLKGAEVHRAPAEDVAMAGDAGAIAPIRKAPARKPPSVANRQAS